jgi:hypothetical protein
MKEKLFSAITNWIAYHYGLEEAGDPCYNIHELVNLIIETIEGGDE